MANVEPQGIVSYRSDADVEETLRRVIEQLGSRNLQLFSVIDHSGAAAGVGLEMPDTKVVVFGNPRGGTPLMLAHPLLALDLPMKLLLAATEDHRTSVSYTAADTLGQRYGLTDTETTALGVVEAIATAVLGA